jgi:hypothetical protein
MPGVEIHQQIIPQIPTHNPDRFRTERVVQNPSKYDVHHKTKTARQGKFCLFYNAISNIAQYKLMY